MNTPHPSRLEAECTSRTNSLANGTINGSQDIELSALSVMDISYILKTKLQGKDILAT